jgi:hypothetical protein
MPLKHGSKIYCQLLLDTNRYKLAEKLAEERGVRVTGMLREFVYSALSQIQPQEYEAAKTADEEVWKESVQRRVEGRQRSKQEKGESNKDA